MVFLISMFFTEKTFHQGRKGAGICKAGIDAHIKVEWKDTSDPFQLIMDLVKQDHGACRMPFFNAQANFIIGCLREMGRKQ